MRMVCGTSSSAGLLAQLGVPGVRLLVWLVLAAVLIGLLVQLLAFARLYRLWMMAFLAGAKIPFMQLVMMKLRRNDPEKLVPLRIMAAQNGLDISAVDLERAVLDGVDVERAVLAMIHGKQSGREVTWDELLRADSSRRLDERSAS